MPLQCTHRGYTKHNAAPNQATSTRTSIRLSNQKIAITTANDTTARSRQYLKSERRRRRGAVERGTTSEDTKSHPRVCRKHLLAQILRTDGHVCHRANVNAEETTENDSTGAERTSRDHFECKTCIKHRVHHKRDLWFIRQVIVMALLQYPRTNTHNKRR